MEELFISDLSLDQSQALVTIVGVPNQPGVAARVFQSIADAGIFVDMIVQSHKGYKGRISLSFTVPADQLPGALEVAQQLAAQFSCHSVTHRPQVAKLSVSGIGLRSHTGVAIRMFRALAEASDQRGHDQHQRSACERRRGWQVRPAGTPATAESVRGRTALTGIKSPLPPPAFRAMG